MGTIKARAREKINIMDTLVIEHASECVRSMRVTLVLITACGLFLVFCPLSSHFSRWLLNAI